MDFIDPRDGETLLDVGCGYGGQLRVGLDHYPFGTVVGWTHSHNQVVEGTKQLSRYRPERWEIHEGDLRQEARVFDHVTSTGMISHVGPRGLLPYVKKIRSLQRVGDVFTTTTLWQNQALLHEYPVGVGSRVVGRLWP